MVFITDRTEADVLLGNEKGVYSFSDLNRVEGNVEVLAAELALLGFSADYTVKTDWQPPGDFTVQEWPVESHMARYLENVRRIRNAFHSSIRLPETMARLTWESANNIEKVLQLAAGRIDGIRQAFRYSGEIFAGEE